MHIAVNELKRKLFHAVGAFPVIPLIFLEFRYALATIGVFAFLAFFLTDYYEGRKHYKNQIKKAVYEFELLPKEKRMKTINDIQKFEQFEDNLFKKIINGGLIREHERKPFYQMFVFFLGALLTAVFFGREIAIVAILALAIGDAMSAIVGVHFGKHKLPYNKNKSFEGVLGFIVFTAIGISAILYAFPMLAVIPIWQIALVAGIVGAAIESAPVVNDNLAVPVGTGLIIFLISHLL